MIRAGIAPSGTGSARAARRIDPYRASDFWHPAGANAGNLAAMAARPRDLIVGPAARAPHGRTASADAVDRVWQDRAEPADRATGARGDHRQLGRAGG